MCLVMFYWWMTFAEEYARLTAERRRKAPISAAADTVEPTPSVPPEPVIRPDITLPKPPTVDREQRLKEALARTEAALRMAQESRSAFLSAMSHELRTPLNAIMGFAEMMKNGVHGPLNNTTYVEYIQHIHDSGGELLSKVNDLLTIGSMNVNEFQLEEEVFRLSELLAEAIAIHSHAAFTRNMRITLDAPDGVEVGADKRQMLCVLAHFLSNAIHHSEDGKEIAITARLQPDDGLILSVRDSGEGIAPQQLKRIHESLQKEACYFTVQGGGIGLGLALARELAARHGGRIMIDSIRHRGTVASLILPRERVVAGMPAKKRRNSP